MILVMDEPEILLVFADDFAVFVDSGRFLIIHTEGFAFLRVIEKELAAFSFVLGIVV